MPRQARKKSSSGIYHVMFREINIAHRTVPCATVINMFGQVIANFAFGGNLSVLQGSIDLF